MVANLTTRLGQLTSTPAGGPYVGKNRIINGNMAVDQRNAGASQTFTAAAAVAYCVDRFYASCTGANITGQQVAGTAPYQYAYKFTGATSNTATLFGQRIESLNIADLVSTNVVCQAQIASSTITTVTWTAYYANSANTFSAKTSIATGTITTTSTPTIYTFSFNAGSNAANGIAIEFTTGALVGSATLQYSGVQLEAGTIATPYEFNQYQAQLAQCQRYYEKSFPLGTAPAGGLASLINTGSAFVNGALLTYIAFKVTKRAAPTFVGYRGNTVAGTDSQWNFYNAVGAWTNGGTTSPNVINTIGIAVQTNDPGGGGITIPANGSTIVDGNWTADAEL